MIKVSFPTGQGGEAAGIVEAVGPGVDAFSVGDEVLGASAGRGAQAEYALLNAGRVVRKPPQISWDLAGGLNTVCATAYAMLAAVEISDRDVVLASGAAGAVGSLAAQLAVAKGATVIGVASQGNHAWLSSHGIIPVAYGDGIAQAIADAAPQGRVDAVLDASGGGYVELAIDLGVAPERIETIADQATAARFPGVKSDGSMAAPMPQALQELTDQVAAGELEVRVERSFPLDEVQAAYELLDHGHPRGKIVLIP